MLRNGEGRLRHENNINTEKKGKRKGVTKEKEKVKD